MTVKEIIILLLLLLGGWTGFKKTEPPVENGERYVIELATEKIRGSATVGESDSITVYILKSVENPNIAMVQHTRHGWDLNWSKGDTVYWNLGQ
jgi:hypothetical protein